MAKKVESIKHKGDKRAHIPSKEEAGYEDNNEKVSSRLSQFSYFLTNIV